MSRPNSSLRQPSSGSQPNRPLAGLTTGQGSGLNRSLRRARRGLTVVVRQTVSMAPSWSCETTARGSLPAGPLVSGTFTASARWARSVGPVTQSTTGLDKMSVSECILTHHDTERDSPADPLDGRAAA